MRSWTSQTGQSTVEYAAAVLLVCALLAGLALVPFDGKPIAGAVTHQLAYALCVVTHGDCDEDRQPCATRTDNASVDWSVNAVVFKVGRHHLLVREDRSDGTVALSLVHTTKGGLDASTGVKAGFKLGRKSFSLGGELSASVLAQTGSGSTWALPKAQADALQRRLEAHFIASPATDLLPDRLVRNLLPDLPPPAQTFGEKGVSASVGGSLGDGASAGLGLSAEDTFGTRVDHRTGRRTYYVKRRNELSGALHVSAFDAEGSAAKGSEYAITVDREGVPVDLEVIETGTLEGSAKLSGPLKEAARSLRTSAQGDRTWVAESHLDLTDPTNREAAQRFIAQVRSPKLRLGPAVEVSKVLSRLLKDRAVVNLRTYDTDSKAYGGSLSGGFEGIHAGVSAEYARERSRLVAASTRGIDGQWRRRDDCLAVAAGGKPRAPAL